MNSQKFSGIAPSGEEENSFQNQYGEPSTNLQNTGVGSRNGGSEVNNNYNGANTVTDTIPIDNSIQHYELPNLTQRKLSLFLTATLQCSTTTPTKRGISSRGASEQATTMHSESCPTISALTSF